MQIDFILLFNCLSTSDHEFHIKICLIHTQGKIKTEFVQNVIFIFGLIIQNGHELTFFAVDKNTT